MITKFTGEGLWFTSDTHFSHKNILNFCNRPFSSVEEHDAVLIDNWNSRIGNDDTVFHLGDFCFAGAPKWKQIREQLNGHIYLIKGNHDDKNLQASLYPLFEDVLYQAKVLIDGQVVYLNHFPFLCFPHANSKHYHDYFIQLFGHCHLGPLCNGSDTDRCNQMLYPTQYDVGVDNNNFSPVSWLQIKEIISQQINNYNGNCK